MTFTPASLLPTALHAVAMASDLVRNSAPGSLTVKGDRDMASEVDFAVERAVRAYLSQQTPDINFLGEEEGETGTSENGLLWALDPVDGTANFVHGLPMCAVSLALIEGNQPVLGVIDLPFLGSRYSAVKDGGAYNEGQRLSVSRTDSLDEAIVSIGDYAVGDNAAHKNRLRLGVTQRLAATVQRVRMLGSAAIDLAWTAEGKLDASIILTNKPWDTAAGALIAREAGALVLDKDGSPHTLDSSATITVTPALADKIIALIRQADDAAT